MRGTPPLLIGMGGIRFLSPHQSAVPADSFHQGKPCFPMAEQAACLHLDLLHLVSTSSSSLASPQAAKLTLSAAPPLPTENASLVFRWILGTGAAAAKVRSAPSGASAGHPLRSLAPPLPTENAPLVFRWILGTGLRRPKSPLPCRAAGGICLRMGQPQADVFLALSPEERQQHEVNRPCWI